TFERTGQVKRQVTTAPSNPTVALLPCADGWVAISPREEHQWSRWLGVMGNPDWGQEPRFADRASPPRDWPALCPLLAACSERRRLIACQGQQPAPPGHLRDRPGPP